MEAYQQRVVDEKAELDDKLGKLTKFIEPNPIFDGLPIEDKELLCRQAGVMREYSIILGSRIARF